MTDIFDDNNEVRSNWVKFTQPGDKIAGTLISIREQESNLPDKKGEMETVYEVKASKGEFHDTDKLGKIIEEAIILKDGEIYNVGGSKSVDTQMRNVKIGQIIGIKFVKELPPKVKGYHPAKIKKVYILRDEKTDQPLMDNEWLKSNDPTRVMDDDGLDGVDVG